MTEFQVTFYEKDMENVVSKGCHLNYWLQKFPRLLQHIYHVFGKMIGVEKKFDNFYPHKDMRFKKPSYFTLETSKKVGTSLEFSQSEGKLSLFIYYYSC